LNDLPLNTFQKQVIQERFVRVVIDAENACCRTRFIYLALTNIITVFGVIVAALIAAEKAPTTSVANTTGGTTAPVAAGVLSWIALALSMAIVLANKWMFVFHIPKKYVLTEVMMEKYYSEGWSFVGGVGRYTDSDIGSRFATFCTRIEALTLQVIEIMPSAENGTDIASILSMGKNTTMQTPTTDANMNVDLISVNPDLIIDLGNAK
jgi:hypothetical protein